jgi:hypothetical protein
VAFLNEAFGFIFYFCGAAAFLFLIRNAETLPSVN